MRTLVFSTAIRLSAKFVRCYSQAMQKFVLAAFLLMLVAPSAFAAGRHHHHVRHHHAHHHRPA